MNFLDEHRTLNTELIVLWQAYKKELCQIIRSSVFDNCIVILYRMWKSSICFNSRWRNGIVNARGTFLESPGKLKSKELKAEGHS